MTTRERALAEALGWIGTPYRHRASVRGQGCDCLGLVRGVWRSLYGVEPAPLPAYAPDWAETGPGEPLLEALSARMPPVPLAEARPGDVLLFRMAPEARIKHAAIVSAEPIAARPGRIVHAYWARAVVESWTVPWWRSRLVAAFAFPDPETV